MHSYYSNMITPGLTVLIPEIVIESMFWSIHPNKSGHSYEKNSLKKEHKLPLERISNCIHSDENSNMSSFTVT